ncbi:MAG TPA: hypothetical protein PLC04_04125 [Candidatus Kapabacteria bacterium]|nr:hypothetical protein [Candidatus Kapabacteria bacterium]
MKKIIWIFFIIFLINNLYAQDTSKISADTLHNQITKQDTFCFKYRFYPKDTLIYQVQTIDSLNQGLDEPIMKDRKETLQVVCDSVDKIMNYYLTLQLLSSETKEWNQKGDSSTRNFSVWIGKEIHLVIDSLGNRLKGWNADTTHIASTLGGIFQPYLFFPIKENCKRINQSWLIKTQDTLFENAFPPGIIDQTSLFRLKDTVYTESDSSLMITFVKTARGFYGINSADMNFIIDAKINSYGELILSMVNQIPKDYTITQELKMQMKYPDEHEIPIWQFTIIHYSLTELKRSKIEEMQTLKKQKR